MTGHRWLRVERPRPDARWRLACFPYAGAGPAAFLKWPDLMDPDIEMAAICLPGRERRIRDPLFDRMEPLVDDLVEIVGDWLRPPYALFGHSMGALIAFAVAQRLDAGGGGPAHLFVSGCVAPPIERTPPFHHLPDGPFLDAVAGYGGLPAEVLVHEELIDIVLPVLRADFAVVETYEPGPDPIRAPITALVGDGDDTVAPDGLRDWGRLTTGDLETDQLPGGHLYLTGQEHRLTELIGDRLRSTRRDHPRP
jgi:surfactin synthase thioesterase subunit